jgi:hypothetical protein
VLAWQVPGAPQVPPMHFPAVPHAANEHEPLGQFELSLHDSPALVPPTQLPQSRLLRQAVPCFGPGPHAAGQSLLIAQPLLMFAPPSHAPAQS